MRTFDTTTTNKINAEVSPDHWRFFGRSFVNSSVTFSYDETRILSMDFSVSGITGSRYEIGTAIAPTMRVVLENSDGALNSFNAQTEWEVHGYFQYDNATEYDAIDTVFIINNITYENSKVIFDCIGAIVLFDVVADESYFNFGSDSANTIIDKICTKVGHGFARSTNFVGEFSKPLSENYTYRDMLRWIGVQNNCGIGVNASKKIKNMIATNTGVTLPNSYFSFSIGKNAVVPKGVRVFSFDGSIYGEYTIDDENPTMCVRNLDMCPQTTTFLSDVAETIYSHYSFTRTPFSAKITRNPRFEVNDIVTVRDLNGNTHTTVITDISFSASGNMSIKCCDEEDDLLNSGITTKISAVKNAVVEVERTAEGLATTVSQVSERVDSAEDSITSLDGRLDTAESDIGTLETGVSGLSNRMTTAESNITQNAQAINLRATKTEFDQYKSEMQTKAVQLVTNGALSLGNKTNFSNGQFTFVPEGVNGSGGCVSTSYYGALFSDEHFPIDTNIEYEVSVDAKGTTGSGRFYFGLCCYDVDKNMINATNCMFINGTTTKLARQLKNGDTKIYLEDASAWIGTLNAYQRGVSIWDYTNSHGFKYPKETYTRKVYPNLWTNYSQIDKVNNVITLDSAWTGGTHEQGEWISQHSDGGNYKYIAASNQIVPTSWTHFSGIVKGIDANGGNDNRKFFPYTVFAKVLILSNYPSGSGDRQYYTNMFVRPSYQKQIDSLSAELTVQAGQISSKVSQTDYNGQTIASKINQSASTVQIEAGHINLNGVVTANNYFKINTDGTFDAVAGHIGGWNVGSDSIFSNSPSISGKQYYVSLNKFTENTQLTDGAIFAYSNDGGVLDFPFVLSWDGKLTAKNAEIIGNITANTGAIGGWSIQNGKLIATVNAFVPFTMADLETAKQITLGTLTPTAQQIQWYDFDRNGIIDIQDMLVIKRYINGQYSIDYIESQYPNYTRSLFPVTVEISPSDMKTIKYTSTAYGRTYEAIYGLEETKATKGEYNEVNSSAFYTNLDRNTYHADASIVDNVFELHDYDNNTALKLSPNDVNLNGTSPVTKNEITSLDSRIIIDGGGYVRFGSMVQVAIRYHSTQNISGVPVFLCNLPQPVVPQGVFGFNGDTGAYVSNIFYWFNGTLYTQPSETNIVANTHYSIVFSYISA